MYTFNFLFADFRQRELPLPCHQTGVRHSWAQQRKVRVLPSQVPQEDDRLVAGQPSRAGQQTEGGIAGDQVRDGGRRGCVSSADLVQRVLPPHLTEALLG